MSERDPRGRETLREGKWERRVKERKCVKTRHAGIWKIQRFIAKLLLSTWFVLHALAVNRYSSTDIVWFLKNPLAKLFALLCIRVVLQSPVGRLYEGQLCYYRASVLPVITVLPPDHVGCPGFPQTIIATEPCVVEYSRGMTFSPLSGDSRPFKMTPWDSAPVCSFTETSFWVGRKLLWQKK